MTESHIPGIGEAVRAAEWSGYPLSEEQQRVLVDYAEWLREEAIPAGGLGPREGERLWDRHIADSLAFASSWAHSPEELLDIGTGVGLPGIPLSVLWPDCHVTLLDRGGRRIRLLRRVVRILALPNVRVAQGDAFSVADEWETMVARAAVKPMEAVGLASRLLADEGTAVVGLSRRAARPEDADSLTAMAEALGLTAEVTQVPPEILDGGSWLFIMRRS